MRRDEQTPQPVAIMCADQSEALSVHDETVSTPSNADQSRGAFEGLRVLDLTSVVLGPFATQTLGDMGADVIKVEGPDGDIMRHAEPMRSDGMGAVFLNINRNKRSIVLDLKQPDGRMALLKLVETADVLIHSIRPQAIARLGLDYETIRAIKPDIIYCATIGFSSRGPYAEQPAYDDVIQGLSGFADLARMRSGSAPEFAPSIICDKIAGLTAYGAIATALYHRTQTGRGQQVEVPMFETISAFVLAEHLAGHAFRPPEAGMGYSRCVSPERRPYQTADGYMAVLPYSTKHWVAFFDAADRPEMRDDPRLASATERSRHFTALYGLVADVMREKTTAEWSKRLREADVPSVPINRLDDLEDDPHLEAVHFFQDYMHSTEGALRTTAIPVAYSDAPGTTLRLPPPRLGAHTREVLSEAGYATSEISALVASGAAQVASG